MDVDDMPRILTFCAAIIILSGISLVGLGPSLNWVY
jgi:hypothetical protein